MGLPLENREFRMEFFITIRMNGLIYLIIMSLPRIITNGICSPEDSHLMGPSSRWTYVEKCGLDSEIN